MSHYIFKLYIVGQTSHSKTAISNLRQLCDEYLFGQYTLTIIDVLEHPELAEEARILATPTLIKELPLPIKRIIGDLSHQATVRAALDLPESEELKRWTPSDA